MSRTQITRDTYPDQYFALLPLLQAQPDLCLGNGVVRVPDGRGWIVQSPLHKPFVEVEVFVVDVDEQLLPTDATGDEVLIEDTLRRIELPEDFPLPKAGA
ncbi:hypothetical protein [Gordonia malaquae]|uniref:hypothetical protein n=1 Tax=Gordonia malaquae TaxID=410332 RepID=UPI003015895E